ncbi:tumor necrosis factor receptor superfamily member 5 [Siniperca chuatsi]|uniref:tumor necrosis factor receptor superfamily member 5 n=1 Tax=Siniperca chuatsi TaxID=119488 RepID=UPI001CE11353|nr:tumor necrosis factor receptor superfamily member 5 [Siniperca chuatsi]
MLRFTTHFTKMHLLLMVMWAFMAMTAAQSRCDPLTQYDKNGQCCKKCVPGTRMTSLGTCLEPQCIECEQNEYQDEYTIEDKCHLQPYCDKHKNFQVNVHESKTQRSTCMCQSGFHCSSNACLTCVAHTTCAPGHGAQSEGNHMHDTVCQKCPEGTFSNETSWDGVCKKWTQCENGYHIQQSGTDISDNICVETSRKHVVVISVVVLVIFVVFISAVMYWMCKVFGKQGDSKGKVKGCVESCLVFKKEPLKDSGVLIAVPTNETEEESMLTEVQTSQEEASERTPEENEDEPSQAMSTEHSFRTENGNYVTQENGKTEILSRQESQTQTFTD